MGDNNFSADRAHELRYMQKWLSAEASTEVSAQLRVINALIPLISIAFSVHRLWTLPVCKLSCIFPIIET